MPTKLKWEDQRAVIYDTEEYEHVHPLNPICFYDDFNAAHTAIPMATEGATISASLSFVDSNPDTITDGASGFVTAGFKADQAIEVSGTTSNNGIYTLATVAAGTLTLIASDALTAEGPVACTITAIGQPGYPWTKKIVGAAPPTVAMVADAAGGIAQCALTAAAQKQDAALFMDDNRQFLITQGVVFEARVKLSALPTTDGEAIWGLVGDWADGPDNITYSVFFTADGSGEIFCEKDDGAGGTDQSATSGVTVTNTDWKVYRIDCRDIASIKFYINGARVASGTTFPYIATGANATLQPYLGMYKALNGAGTIQIDEVRIWGNRS